MLHSNTNSGVITQQRSGHTFLMTAVSIERFVKTKYLEVLQRPADLDELLHYTEAIKAGDLKREELVDILKNSDEFFRVDQSELTKIVHMSTYEVQCGIAVYLEQIINALIPVDRNIDQIVFAEKIPDGDERTSESYLLSRPRVIRNWLRNECFDDVINDLHAIKPNIFHIQHEWSYFPVTSQHFISLLQKSKSQWIKNVLTYHTVFGRDEYAPFSDVVDYFRNIDPYVDLFIVHTDQCYKNMLDTGIVNESKLVKVSMPAFPINNISKSEAQLKRLPEAYRSKKRIVTGGFLLPNKGVDKIIIALSVGGYENLSLVCIGGSHPWSPGLYAEYRETCERYAAQSGIDVLFDYRFMDDSTISEYLACADIVLLNYGHTLSGNSGWGRRAIASQRPVIVTDVLLFQDFIDGVNCLKIPPDDINAMLNAINRLLTDKELCDKLIHNATIYAKKISHDNIAKEYQRLYKKVFYE